MKYSMRKYIAAASVILIIACNPGTEKTGNLEKLHHERDSLKELFSTVNLRLKAVEAEIALSDTAAEARAMLVSTKLLAPEKFEHFIEVHGVVESEKNVTLNAEVNSIIKSITVSEGEKVSKGQVLVILDNDVILRNMDELETAYELSNTVFQRQEKLWKQNIGSEMQYLEAKNRKESLELKLKTLKSQKEMTVVKAPFSGIIDQIFPKEGEMASPMAPLIRLINLDEMYVTADVPENYLKTIKTGSRAVVKFPSIDVELTSKISRVGQFINPNNRTFRIRLALDESSEMLRPNLLSVMMVKIFEKDSGTVVPSSAIQQDARGNEYVFVVERTGKSTFARKSNIKSERTFNNKTLVAEGLYGNEEIIMEGARGLKENEKIEISN